MWRGSEGGQGDGDSDSNGEWIYFSIHEHTDPGKDKILDLLICLRDHAEREADIDKDHSQLLASTIPQPLPPPHACTAIRRAEDVSSDSIAGLIRNYHPDQSMWIYDGEIIVQEINYCNRENHRNARGPR